MRDNILIEVFNNSRLKAYIRKIAPYSYEEVHSSLMMDLMTKVDEYKLCKLHASDELEPYLRVMAKNMVSNPLSPFNREKHQNTTEITDYLEDTYEADLSNPEEGLIEQEDTYEVKMLLVGIQEWLSERTDKVEGAFYDEILFNKYFRFGNTFREISDNTKIPLSEIYSGISAVQQVVVTKFKERYDGVINK